MSTALKSQHLAVFYRSSPHSPLHLLLRIVNTSRFNSCRTYATSVANLPRVVQPSVWHSIIPKAFRNPEYSRLPAKPKSTNEWNPATFFICIFLLIGSNAIQMLALKNEYSTFSRKADAKIKLLKDVLDRVQRGENVDVEKVLGTGDEEQEKEWEDVVRHLGEEGQLWQAKERKRQKEQPQNEQEAELDDTEEVIEEKTTGDTDLENVKPAPKFVKPSDFY